MIGVLRNAQEYLPYTMAASIMMKGYWVVTWETHDRPLVVDRPPH